MFRRLSVRTPLLIPLRDSYGTASHECRHGPKLDVVLVLHTVALAWFLRVWLWHFTPQATLLPGSRGFGWFTRYLTFYSFTLQLVQLLLCCSSAFLKVSTSKSDFKVITEETMTGSVTPSSLHTPALPKASLYCTAGVQSTNDC